MDPPCRSRIQDPGWDQEPQTQLVPPQRVLRGRCLSGAELGVPPGAFPPPPRSRCPAPRCQSSRAATLPTSQFSSALSRRKCPSWNQRVQREGSQTDGGQGKDGRLLPAPLLRLPLPCPKRCPLPGPRGGKAEGLVAPWAGWVLGWGPGGLVPATRALQLLPGTAAPCRSSLRKHPARIPPRLILVLPRDHQQLIRAPAPAAAPRENPRCKARALQPSPHLPSGDVKALDEQ